MSFPRYERYKDSGVDWLGEVPEHWQVKRLRYALQLVTAKATSDEYVIALENIESWTAKLIQTETEFSGEGVEFRKGDVLFGKLRPYLAKAYLAERDGAAVGDFHVLRPRAGVHGNYALYLFLNSSFIDVINGSTIGAKMPRATWPFLADLNLVVPPPEEQQTIASFVTDEVAKLDALVEEQRRLIQLLKEKRQAVISHAITKGLRPDVPMKNSGVEWLGETPQHWVLLPAKHVSTIFVPQRNKPDLNTAGEGLPWITMDQMKSGEISESDHWVSADAAVIAGSRTLKEGSVLASCVGSFGAASVTTRDVIVNQQLQAFVPNERIRAKFLRDCVTSSKAYFEQIGTAATLAYVNQQGFAALPLALPPLGEQDLIVEYVSHMLSFPNGALVHFAVSNMEAHMTTKLAGPVTQFLPFNRGDHGASGNPLSPTGHRTSYLWEEVWQRDSWLEILGRYLVAHKDTKKQIASIVFPRYHQLDATRKLLHAVLATGAGGKYLIQHSAGSGKTNSIAWSAHFLADLHDAGNKKVFDSVLVVSDRNVIDQQLQDAIFGFERTAGVVASIKGESSSKSGELAAALSGDKKIVVCTIQTFPFALKAVRELAAAEGKRFAVIADEAHSSQTGETAAKLKAVLSAEELKEITDGGEISTEDLLVAQMSARTDDASITYVAFTATPKSKTLELFGQRPHPEQPAGSENLPAPFHVYSMRQAIEEGFILDVLQNYTPYKLAFRLAHNGKEWDQNEVERSQAMKGIMRWVRLHPYNISQKVQVVVEHFLENVQPLLNGHAKAMVVVGSRLEAVRWQLAIDKYIKAQGYGISTLVAFSGEVIDKESGHDPFTENSKALNPNLRGRDMREAFNTDEYQILLVANKFQTGFDQPLLCGMYVDKRLGGIQAVQTLSRLNRSYSGPFGKKDTTYVLDFVNNPDEVLEAFKVYYETAIDLSKVLLTHHTLKHQGKRPMSLGEGEAPKLQPLTDTGSGSVQEKEKALLAEIIEKVNDLFAGDLTEDDKLVYVNNVIKGKLLESDTLVQQAANNTKEQFANSPDLANGILNAIMDAFSAHTTMSKQALDSAKVRGGLKDVLLGPAQLYEALRERALGA